jgi:NAD(P)-dependent dehydrogenase (short-subunit alcohol dehydrogenase family)
MKNIVITGATEGIGKATAIALAADAGVRLILHGRSESKLSVVKEELEKVHGTGRVDTVVADFASLREVKSLGERLRDAYPTIDVLINNVGAMFSERGETVDGFERTFAVNYLAPTLLTELLHARMAPQGRIINLSSVGYKSAKPDFDDLQSRRSYKMMPAYFNAKLFNLYYTLSLAERLRGSGITVNAAHPGGVRTQLARDFKGPLRFLFSLMMPLFFIPPAKGAETSVYLACSPDVRTVSGRYFVKCKSEMLTPIGEHQGNRERLRELTNTHLAPCLRSNQE